MADAMDKATTRNPAFASWLHTLWLEDPKKDDGWGQYPFIGEFDSRSAEAWRVVLSQLESLRELKVHAYLPMPAFAQIAHWNGSTIKTMEISIPTIVLTEWVPHLNLFRALEELRLDITYENPIQENRHKLYGEYMDKNPQDCRLCLPSLHSLEIFHLLVEVMMQSLSRAELPKLTNFSVHNYSTRHLIESAFLQINGAKLTFFATSSITKLAGLVPYMPQLATVDIPCQHTTAEMFRVLPLSVTKVVLRDEMSDNHLREGYARFAPNSTGIVKLSSIMLKLPKTLQKHPETNILPIFHIASHEKFTGHRLFTWREKLTRFVDECTMEEKRSFSAAARVFFAWGAAILDEAGVALHDAPPVLEASMKAPTTEQ